MSYTILDPQPELNADETAVELDDGTLVAVSVTTNREANNTALVFTATARCINTDGTDANCPVGDPITTSFCHAACAAEVANLTQATIAQEMLKALLGEPLGTHVVDDVETPLIFWPPDFLAHSNIRNAIAFANASVVINPASLL